MDAPYRGLKEPAHGYSGRRMDDALSIRTSREGTTATVAASGEIDLSTADDLRSAVTAAAQ